MTASKPHSESVQVREFLDEWYDMGPVEQMRLGGDFADLFASELKSLLEQYEGVLHDLTIARETLAEVSSERDSWKLYRTQEHERLKEQYAAAQDALEDTLERAERAEERNEDLELRLRAALEALDFYYERFGRPSNPAKECHICHRPLDEPGEEYCSAAHPLPNPASRAPATDTPFDAPKMQQIGVSSPAKKPPTPDTPEFWGGVFGGTASNQESSPE